VPGGVSRMAVILPIMANLLAERWQFVRLFPASD
jgi:hypothetical protein